MKTNNKILSVLLLAIIAIGFGCTKDFEEINTNPNSPTLELAAPDMLLTQALESMTDRVHNIFLGHEMGSCWAQHMAKVQYTDEDRYIPRVSVINAAWSSFYAASGMDINTIYNIAVEGENENYQGVALVLKVYIASVLTDMFGDIPYTQAWSEGVLSPTYDSQAEVYGYMLDDLETANDLLDPDGAEIGGDILFGNDILSWKKFANSLRLRLALRQSSRVDPTALMTMIHGDPATYPIFESNDDNAALPYLGSAPNNHPINENRKTRDDHRVSKTLVDLMWNGSAPEPDYRILAYADNSSVLEGLPNGMRSADAGAYLGNGLTATSEIGPWFARGDAPGQLMSYAELQFILAEAAHKDYIPGGEVLADSFYRHGIRTSYMQFAEPMDDGLDIQYGVSSEDGYTWDVLYDWFITDGGWVYDQTDADKADEQIATQRWAATFDQGLQSWFEWRRTGYPVLTPAVDGVLDGQIPRRVYYGSDEYARNNQNVSDAAAAQGMTSDSDLLTPVWWDN